MAYLWDANTAARLTRRMPTLPLELRKVRKVGRRPPQTTRQGHTHDLCIPLKVAGLFQWLLNHSSIHDLVHILNELRAVRGAERDDNLTGVAMIYTRVVETSCFHE